MKIPPKKRGRTKGSQNKASKTLREALENLKFNLADEVVKLYQDPELPLNTKVRLLETLLQFTHPRLKEQEVAPPSELPKDISAKDATTDQLLSLVKK